MIPRSPRTLAIRTSLALAICCPVAAAQGSSGCTETISFSGVTPGQVINNDPSS